jgi:hypothetical protein
VGAVGAPPAERIAHFDGGRRLLQLRDFPAMTDGVKMRKSHSEHFSTFVPQNVLQNYFHDQNEQY